MYIYLSVSPTRQDLTQGLFYSGDLREREIAHKPRLVHCWLMMITRCNCELCKPLLSLPECMPDDLADHRFTRPEGLM